MMPIRPTWFVRGASVAAVLLLSGPVATRPIHATQAVAQQATRSAALPARLTDREFWKLVSDVSEPGGYFRIELRRGTDAGI